MTWMNIYKIRTELGGGTVSLQFKRKGETFKVTETNYGLATQGYQVKRSNGAEYLFYTGKEIRQWLERMEPV